MDFDSVISLVDDIEKLCYLGDNENVLGKTVELINGLENIEITNQSFLSVVNLLSLALEKKDYILLADYLEFGLKPALLNHDVPKWIYDLKTVTIPDIAEDVFYLTSCTDELVLCARREDGEIVKFNSSVSPAHEADVLFSSIKMKNNTPVVCLFGIGTGLVAEKVLNNLPDNGKLIVYEPNESIIDYCLKCSKEKECDITEKIIGDRLKNIIDDERVHIYYFSNKNKAFVDFLFARINYRDLYGLLFIVNSGYKDYCSNGCLDFIRNIEDFRRITLTNRNTLIKKENYYIEYVFRNLNVLKDMNLSSEIGKILPQDIPVIIVAAGPSLEKNAEILKNAKGHFLIVAVDTALRYLLPHNIIPDLTITVDPKKPVSCYSDERSIEIPCIIDLDGNYEIIERLKGRIFVLARNRYFTTLLRSINKEVNEDPIGGGSVATVIFAILCSLGQKNIILIGQDLASSNGKTHAIEENNGTLGSVFVEGIDGNKVLSRNDWLVFLKWYEASIKTYKTFCEGCRIIDATEGGAKIHGTEIMSLKKAIDEFRDCNGDLPEYDFRCELTKLEKYLNDDDYKNICINHKRNISKLNELINKSEDVVRVCEKIINGIEKGTVTNSYINKEKKRIHNIHDEYMNNPMHSLINTYLNGAIVHEVSRLSLAEGDARQTEMNGIKLLKLSFENIATVAKKILENAKKYEYLLE